MVCVAREGGHCVNIRICLVGDFRSAYLGTLWESGLQEKKATVIRCDTSKDYARLHSLLKSRIFHRLSLNSYSVRERLSKDYNKYIGDFVQKQEPDAVVFHNGYFIFPKTIEEIKKKKIKTVMFHADNPFRPYSYRPETFPTARMVDHVLVWSQLLADKIRQKQRANASFFPFGWDRKLFPYQEPPPRQWDGITFIGNWERSREDFLDQIGRNFPLRIFGEGYWGERTRFAGLSRRAWAGRGIVGPEAAGEVRNAAINLNILRRQHFIDGVPDGVIMRTFEAPGAGGFLLSTRSGGASDLFPEGDAGAYFSDVNECLEKIEYYLTHSVERRSIAAQAHRRVKERHTYANRAAELIELIRN
jgi:spore maturation protein CgeB